MASNSVVVIQGEKPYAVSITAGAHSLKGDESPEWGGADVGPNPYEYLLAALGSCTAITLRLYAEHKGYTISALKVTLAHEKLKNSQDKITRHIEIDGDFDEAALPRFLDIAAKCPVARTLSGAVEMENKIESPQSSVELSALEKKE